jgi:hypothetical protein
MIGVARNRHVSRRARFAARVRTALTLTGIARTLRPFIHRLEEAAMQKDLALSSAIAA